MTRGPYETSLIKFAECTCTVLELEEAYTLNEAREKCGIGHRTIRNYVTVNLSDVNLELEEECGRIIKREDVSRTLKFPGFKVGKSLPRKVTSVSEQCTVEPPERARGKFDFPPDLFTARVKTFGTNHHSFNMTESLSKDSIWNKTVVKKIFWNASARALRKRGIAEAR